MSEERRYPLGPILVLGASLVGIVAVIGSVTLILMAHMIGALS